MSFDAQLATVSVLWVVVLPLVIIIVHVRGNRRLEREQDKVDRMRREYWNATAAKVTPFKCKCGEAFRGAASFCHRCGGENNAACPPLRPGSILGRSPEGAIRGYKPGDVPLGIATHGTVRSNALLYTGVHPAYGWTSFESVTQSTSTRSPR